MDDVPPGPLPVSVVIPTFCAARTISRAIRSVLKQDQAPEQLIVVDDASGDGTIAAVERVTAAVRIPEVRIIRLSENGGPAIARNRGWDDASGSYVAFLDADDFWHPAKLRLQCNWMLARPEVAITGHKRAWGAHAQLDDPERKFAATLLQPRHVLYRSPFVTPSVLLRRDLPFRFEPNFRRAEDFLLWSMIIMNGLLAYRLEVALVTLGKAPWGAGGLSADIWAMQKRRAEATRYLRDYGLISTPVMATSIAKGWLSTASQFLRIAGTGRA